MRTKISGEYSVNTNTIWIRFYDTFSEEWHSNAFSPEVAKKYHEELGKAIEEYDNFKTKYGRHKPNYKNTLEYLKKTGGI